MKKLFIIANWKSNKTIEETEKWLHDLSEGLNKENINLGDKKIIIAPSFISLEHANYCAKNLKFPVEFAAQDISAFDEGAYTGEINGRQIKELANYVIIGHSERRKYFGETDELIGQKVSIATHYDLAPIFCIQNENTPIPHGAEIVAYEPVFAIGSGHPDTPENAEEMSKSIKKELGDIPVLYGGSVVPENVKSFTSMPNIEGVLVGGASLDSHKFLEIIKNA